MRDNKFSKKEPLLYSDFRHVEFAPSLSKRTTNTNLEMTEQSRTMYRAWGKMWKDAVSNSENMSSVDEKTRCQSCGQWGEHQSTCKHCGSPTT